MRDPHARDRYAVLVRGDGVSVPLLHGAPTEVIVYSRHWLRLAGWSCFFIGFAVRWAARERLARGRAGLLACCLAACLLLPVPLASLPAALFWGLVLATVARWTGLLSRPSTEVTLDSQTAYITPAL